MPRVGLHVRFTPATKDGVQPNDVVAQVTKVHSASCVNLQVIEDGDSFGERHTSVCVGSGAFSFGLLPRSHYLPFVE